MKFEYFPDTDTLYIGFRPVPAPTPLRSPLT